MSIPMSRAERNLRRQIGKWIRSGSHGRIDCRCPECVEHRVPHANWLASVHKLAEMIENGEDTPLIDIEMRQR